MVAGAGALVYLLWKNSKSDKPEPNTIMDGEECIANGYFWGGNGVRAACFKNEQAAN